MTKKSKFWNEVLEMADEWESKGWLHKFRDELGREIWELTPLGCREFGLSVPYRQKL
jgi:hypothetical protein